jgi:hypothetical protein
MHTYIHTYIYAVVEESLATGDLHVNDLWEWINETTKKIFKDTVCGDGKLGCLCIYAYVCACMYVYMLERIFFRHPVTVYTA